MRSPLLLLMSLTSRPLAEYLVCATSLAVAINLVSGNSKWPLAAILRPLLQSTEGPPAVFVWQILYLTYTLLAGIYVSRTPAQFQKIKDPGKLLHPLATVFVLIVWAVTIFMHRYSAQSAVDQLLLHSPAVALVLWFKCRLTSRWLAVLLRRKQDNFME